MVADTLNEAIILDQLKAVRRTVNISIPVNILLGTACWVVAWHSGNGEAGATWFMLSLAVNLARIALCCYPIHEPGLGEDAGTLPLRLGMRRHLRLHWMLALVSGFCWALIPLLCEGYTSPQTLFYLTVVCGITAGAVTHGFAYALIPICFITPPLASIIGCLLWAGGFDRYCLAAAVLLYAAALVRSTRVGEALVRSDSRLKNEATSLSRSLEIANRKANAYALEMKGKSIHDDLTGLLNRRGFAETLERMPADGGEWSLLLLDLDGFKSVNDAFGHKAGDRVLVEVARRLKGAVSQDAHVARLGGDEFVVFLDQKACEESAAVLATRLIAALAIPYGNLDAGRVGVSIGIYTGPKLDSDEMLIAADTALLTAKREGRNRFRLFDDSLRREARVRRDIERDLSAALGLGQLEVWYQPIVDGRRRLDTFEALLRWKHPHHGWISPTELVGTAAMAGLAEPLTNFIFNEVKTMIGELRRLGLHHVRVAMNISPREIAQIDIDDLILNGFEAAGLPASMLELEVTEEIAINPHRVHGKLTRLTKAGVHLALDDFGTGYSSLGSLQHLKVNRVKIDRSFVSGMAGSTAGRSLVEAVLKVSEAFGFDVVAEGVETAEDMRAVMDLGCPLMQGYLFAKPMPFKDAAAWAKISGIRIGAH